MTSALASYAWGYLAIVAIAFIFLAYTFVLRIPRLKREVEFWRREKESVGGLLENERHTIRTLLNEHKKLAFNAIRANQYIREVKLRLATFVEGAEKQRAALSYVANFSAIHLNPAQDVSVEKLAEYVHRLSMYAREALNEKSAADLGRMLDRMKSLTRPEPENCSRGPQGCAQRPDEA